MLRPGEVGTPSSPPSACQIVLRRFQYYLRQERGLAEATITYYTSVVSAFLAECLTSISSAPVSLPTSSNAARSALPPNTQKTRPARCALFSGTYSIAARSTPTWPRACPLL